MKITRPVIAAGMIPPEPSGRLGQLVVVDDGRGIAGGMTGTETVKWSKVVRDAKIEAQ